MVLSSCDVSVVLFSCDFSVVRSSCDVSIFLLAATFMWFFLAAFCVILSSYGNGTHMSVTIICIFSSCYNCTYCDYSL